ncbi:MAG TPA: response regulator [Coriobacteriia bacterium]|nr:response regulator [Coriobacteriia bacterium]
MARGYILLVEDNPADEALTIRALRRHEMPVEIDVVRDGQEAIDYLLCEGAHADRDPFDMPQVVLLDLKLPKLSGHDVLRAIRANDRTRRLPVVVMTSSSQERDIQMSYDLGANSYVRKPVESGAFSDVVQQLGLYWLATNETSTGT